MKKQADNEINPNDPNPKKVWQNRIVEQGEKPAKDFKFNPKNWRLHPQTQRDALNGILESVGWVQSVIVLPDGTLIDGHARIEEALKLGDDTPVPFTMVNLSEKEAELMLALFDPLGAMANADTEKFNELSALLELESSALLEVVADLSRANLSDIAELPRQDNSVGEMLQYLKFDGEAIPLTDDELAGLRERLKAYIEEKGVIYGFAAHLLGM